MPTEPFKDRSVIPELAGLKLRVKCHYCANQGLHEMAQLCTGDDAKVQKKHYPWPEQIRYACERGHKFSVDRKQVAA